MGVHTDHKTAESGPEKASLLPQTEQPPIPRQPTPSRFGRIPAVALVVIIGLFWLLTRSWTCGHHRIQEDVGSKVSLEVHIMSKCPDARDCLEKLIIPTMANVSDKVDFKLSFIGRPTEEDGGVQCMHGQTECLGNILELCAADTYPDPKIYLGFVNCLSHSYHDIPKKELIESCALEYGMEFEKLNECSSRDDGAYGMDLLRDSVTRSKDLGVSTSCTIRLAGKTRCVRDGGKWRDCKGGAEPADLIGDIEGKYDEAQGWADWEVLP